MSNSNHGKKHFLDERGARAKQPQRRIVQEDDSDDHFDWRQAVHQAGEEKEGVLDEIGTKG